MLTGLVPRLSAHDPAAEGEGSLDPLGLEAIAERLADQLLPGMTARMHRVRALTFMAVSAHVTEPFRDEYTADETSPSYLVFEWMYAEAMAHAGVETLAIPGVRKAEGVLRGGGRLATRLYLKSPRALGIHGFYRRLARATRITDSSDYLDENGEVLLARWEQDRGLKGFLDGRGEGGKALESLRADLAKGLKASESRLRRQARGARELRAGLTPAFPSGSGRERTELRRILDEDERRGEVLHLLDRFMDEDAPADEAVLANWLERHGSPELSTVAAATTTYQRLSRALSDGFDLLRWRSTQNQARPASPADLAEASHVELAMRLPGLIEAVEEASGGTDADQGRDELLGAFAEVRSGEQLAEALIGRHEAVQSRKGSVGKRPWFEHTDQGIVVRTAYAKFERPDLLDAFVHPTRLSNGCEFLAELA